MFDTSMMISTFTLLVVQHGKGFSTSCLTAIGKAIIEAIALLA
jgi:hypothetical protein